MRLRAFNTKACHVGSQANWTHDGASKGLSNISMLNLEFKNSRCFFSYPTEKKNNQTKTILIIIGANFLFITDSNLKEKEALQM